MLSLQVFNSVLLSLLKFTIYIKEKGTIKLYLIYQKVYLGHCQTSMMELFWENN